MMKDREPEESAESLLLDGLACLLIGAGCLFALGLDRRVVAVLGVAVLAAMVRAGRSDGGLG